MVLSDALAFAHAHGVLHRDVKPQNVLVLPTSWVLADFGIARLVDAEHTSSVETFTYRHASPQILDGQPPTAADDIWSLGSTLFTLLDGPRRRSPATTPTTTPPWPTCAGSAPSTTAPFSSDVGALGAVIGRCLVKDVTARWGSVHELRDALLRLRHGAWEPGHEATRPRSAGTRGVGTAGAGAGPACDPASRLRPRLRRRRRQPSPRRPDRSTSTPATDPVPARWRTPTGRTATMPRPLPGAAGRSCSSASSRW